MADRKLQATDFAKIPKRKEKARPVQAWPTNLQRGQTEKIHADKAFDEPG